MSSKPTLQGVISRLEATVERVDKVLADHVVAICALCKHPLLESEVFDFEDAAYCKDCYCFDDMFNC